MATICKAREALGYCQNGVYKKLCKLLDAFQLPYHTSYDADIIFTSTLNDKKRSGNICNVIMPNRIGACTILPTSIEDLYEIIKAGLAL